MLPSNFLPYPDSTTVYYRPYTFREIYTLNTSDLALAEEYKFVLGGIQTTNIEPSELTLGDFLFVSLHRKVATLNTDNFQVAYIPSNHVSLGVQTHSFTFEDAEFNEIDAPALPVIYTTTKGKELRFMPLTIGQMIELVEEFGEDIAEDTIKVLAKECTNLPFEEAEEIIGGSYGEDVHYFSKIDDILEHNVKNQEAEYTTPDGELARETIEIDAFGSLVLPFRGGAEYKRDAIQFGVQEDS